MMFLNESEARQLTNESNLIKAARVILSFGPKTVIIKKGENGVFVLSENVLFSMPAYPCELVCDPTGAGDSYRGGLLCGLVRGMELEQCARMGSACASLSVECYGTQEYSFSPEEFDDRLSSCN